MEHRQTIGLVALVIGVVLLYFGYQASQSAGGQIAEAFTGRYSDITTWYVVFSAAAAIGGLVVLMLRR